MKSSKHLLFIFLLIIFAINGYALPRFALRQGARCSDCHIDPTGGGMRNSGGFHFGWRVLPLIYPADKNFKFGNHIGPNIKIGIDYRTQYLYSQQFGKTTFQKMEGTLYSDIQLSDKIDAYAAYDFVNATWIGMAIAHILPNNSYIKAGSFIPDYGLKIDDHTAYTRGGDLGYLFTTNKRQGLIFDPRYSITGAEIGYNIGEVGLITASVGSPVPLDFNTDPTYTINAMFNPVIANKYALMLGASFMTFKGPLIYTQLPTEHKVTMYGGYLGLGVGNFTITGEYDIAHDYEAVGTNSSAAMVQGAYVLFKGLEAVVRYDLFNPNISVSNDQVSRIVAGFEFFPYSFIEIRPQYRFQFETPQVKNDSFVLQFHFYY